jgi:methanogenic corrinoid protein MtbC1
MNNPAIDAIAEFEKCFLDFRIDAIAGVTDRMIQASVTARDFLNTCMPCMDQIGEKFEAGEYYLPQLVVAGEMFKIASQKFKDRVSRTDTGEPLGRMVLGTPKGDIHSLGKDIFGVLAEASGFAVHDLGVDADPETFIRSLKDTRSNILGMSSLLTTNFDSIAEIIRLLDQNGLRGSVLVIIGGGATEPSLVKKLNVDAQTRDAYEGIRILKEYAAQNRKMAAA